MGALRSGERGIRRVLLAIGLALAVIPVVAKATAPGAASIEVLSGRADLVSGGDAVVAVRIPQGIQPADIRVSLGGQDITAAFALRPGGAFGGVVQGLQVGANVVTAALPDGHGARLTINNHRNGGPLFAGPQLQPWVCQKGAVDEQCNQAPEYVYLYRSTDPSTSGLRSYNPNNPPSDVATATTDQGVRVPFIVRLETGYQDRDQYKILALFEPGKPWDRWAPQRQWNHKLLVTHGGGCGAAHGTGGAPLADFSGTFSGVPVITDSYITALGRGFAVMSTALDNNGHNCNVVLQAESLIMAKERLIEQYGDVRYTIGTGCSGGSITQQQVANAYPDGVYDGLIVTCAYPDDLSTGAQFADYSMLRRYFEDRTKWGPGIVWTPSQWAAVEGRPDPVNAIVADEEFFKSATNPAGGCVPAEQQYDARTNPGGVRCSILDAMINVLGPRPQSVWSPMERAAGHGFAGQPFGNVGIQYGLGALRSGLITPEQFIDLNAAIGGADIDAKPMRQRISGDGGALANAYRSGAINEANNMGNVAIIDHAGPDPGLAHDYVHTWWMRDRLEREFGDYRNHVLWFGPEPLVGNLHWATQALIDMDRWLAAVERDHSNSPIAQKIVDDKPSDITDRCEYVPDLRVRAADGVCLPPLAQTRYGTPRTVAGGLETSDTNACSLTPLLRRDEPVRFTDKQWARLQAIFPTGVCDWSRPGVGQQPTIAWLTYQDAVGNVIYGGTPMGPPPESTPF